ncbi:MAG: glycoside hydrolase family 15 protein [Gemmataceae bacterium]
MTILLSQHPAFGWPGIPPRWSRSDKDGVGTAYSALSRVWFTVSKGILNEVYYPTIDRPQLRDLQFLITDGETFCHDERRYLESSIEYLAHYTLGFRVVTRDPQGRYQITKEIITDPHHSCVLLHTTLDAEPSLLNKLKLYVLLAPHLEVGGGGNFGNVAQTPYGRVLTAHKGNTWLAVACTIPFAHCSCGYVGTSDGWQDLMSNHEMNWQFDSAYNGNIALTGEIDLRQGREFVIGLAFGDSLHTALMTLYQALTTPFAEHRERFIEQWHRPTAHMDQAIAEWRKHFGRTGVELSSFTGDSGHLFRTSKSILLAHEDKFYDGALIASMSIPWGEAKGDEDLGGYHLVWTRDMCGSASGLLAAGDLETPFRALIYLAFTQRPDGGFYQNFWLNGEAYWKGVQLDEVAFPIVLAWRLHRANALKDFDPLPMVLRACRYLLLNGPATGQERWEENSGYSPSTLAVQIAGLVCAAAFARLHGDAATAQFLEQYADFLESHVEAWTMTTEGTLVPGIKRHYIRIHPMDLNDPRADENANHGMIPIRNRPPGAQVEFPAKEIVDAGFLELVRYGIRRPCDPVILDSLRVIDAVLKVDTPFGPCWRRYNHDGYGQRADGGPFQGWGQGRAWPLLTGERGHYELAAGHDPLPYIKAMENFASANALLPEQIWDEPDRPDLFMYLGRPTGGAMPLCWAHAEYIKLVRSAADGQVFDLIPEVADRYLGNGTRQPLEVWKFNRQLQAVTPGQTVRIQTAAPFRLHWTNDDWKTRRDTPSIATAIGVHYVDIPIALKQKPPLRFTFFWIDDQRWENKDFQVTIVAR